ncbi:MAG: intradiol ring-cleavage dioxygenase [Deltaproteobacteria bacterium]|nr:intradiol ring-cleavage dioxygenase [Deltaproteobacteria bacterium]
MQAFSALLFFLAVAAAAPDWQCRPTPQDALGPFYKPNAPERASVGQGYVLQGVVKSAKDCAPLAGAKIEFWLAGPDGNYDDAHRATMTADKSGAYRFESNFPPNYSSRPPHIHIKVSAPGFRALVRQHYPKEGQTQGTFDLVLVPAG